MQYDSGEDNAHKKCKSPSPAKSTHSVAKKEKHEVERSGLFWESRNTSSEGSPSEDLSDFELDISYQDENNIGTSSHTDSDPESET